MTSINDKPWLMPPKHQSALESAAISFCAVNGRTIALNLFVNIEVSVPYEYTLSLNKYFVSNLLS